MLLSGAPGVAVRGWKNKCVWMGRGRKRARILIKSWHRFSSWTSRLYNTLLIHTQLKIFFTLCPAIPHYHTYVHTHTHTHIPRWRIKNKIKRPDYLFLFYSIPFRTFWQQRETIILNHFHTHTPWEKYHLRLNWSLSFLFLTFHMLVFCFSHVTYIIAMVTIY